MKRTTSKVRMHRFRNGRVRSGRSGFSIIEVLLAISITSMLLTSLLAALNASFRAYQSTTESASRHTVARLTMHRMLAMIRTGTDFGPFPSNVITDPIILSDYVEFITTDGQYIRIEFREFEEALYVIIDPDEEEPEEQLLLSGVKPRYDEEDELIPPFTLHYQKGPLLYRATIDIEVAGDPGIELVVEGDDVPPLRIIASAMPRNNL
jgi:prepilin-type N-terminal cleavage/methylation domain-containing protein